jgi:hypothetical protein
MKQKLILCIIIATGGFTAHAQTVQTMTQQLAVLHSLGQSLQKGYTLASHGLQNIGNHQDGEYQQHVRYFNSLYSINPNIYSPSKQTYAQNSDNPWSKPADSDRQAPDSSRSH